MVCSRNDKHDDNIQSSSKKERIRRTIRQGGILKMGLFKRTKITKPQGEGENEQLPPVSMIDPSTLYHNTIDLQEELTIMLRQYESLTRSGNTLKLEQYKMMIKSFQSLAQEFEKIYELMRFDIDKLEEINKYHDRAQAKREQLLQQLNNEPKNPPKDEQAQKGR